MKMRLGVSFAMLALAGCGQTTSQAPASTAASGSGTSVAQGTSTLHPPSAAQPQMPATPSMAAEQAVTSSASDELLHCRDVQYGNPNYSDNMDKLAKLARLPDNYYTRYDEDIVGYLCKGDTKSIQDEVNAGFVKQSEVDGIREALGLDNRSDIGMSYGYSRQKFSDMGLCDACADNVAQYYTKKPASKCGKLAKHALEGDPRAIDTLKSFPEYCTWQY